LLHRGARRVGAGDPSEGRADRHADAGGVALAQHVAGHHFAGHEQVVAWNVAEAHGRRVVGAQSEIGEGDARLERVAIERRRVDRPCPVRLGGEHAFGVAVVQLRVVEAAGAAGGVVVLQRAQEGGCVQPQLARELRQRVRQDAGEHGRHEAADGLAVDDRVADLPRLLRHEAAPDRVALGPEVLALVVEAPGFAVDHHAQRDAVDARADATVVQRSACVDGDHVGLRRIADPVGAVVIQQVLEQHALVEARAADQEVVGRPFAAFVLPPGLAQPGDVGLEAAGGQHAGACLDALALHPGGQEAAVLDLDAVHRRLVADAHAQPLRTAVVGVDQRLAAAHEESIGARHVQCAGQRWLEVHAVAAHPVAAGGRGADGQPCEVFIGQAAGDLQQVLPVLLFRIGLDQHVLRCVVHAAQVARVHGIAAAPFARRRFQQ
jgi:hypothetical protein